MERGGKFSFEFISPSQSAPGIYTDVASHIEWIKDMVKANGGMATCSGLLSVPPALGNIPFLLLLCSQTLNIRGVPKERTSELPSIS